jgi:hypothetical protein
MLKWLPALAFLTAYFLTVVLGNAMFSTPVGMWALTTLDYPIDALLFPETFTLGFWMLLLMPFVVTPPLVWLAQRVMMSGPPQRLFKLIPEIGRPEFACAITVLIVYLGYSFWKADVLGLFGAGASFSTSVESRFAIRDALGNWPIIALHSVLWFLSLYAFIRTLRERKAFWAVAFLVTFIVVSSLLLMLNMKWPVLLYLVALLLAFMCFSGRRAILVVAGLATTVIVLYMAVSVIVLRIDLDDESAKLAAQQATIMKEDPSASFPPVQTRDEALAKWAAVLFLSPFSRMAIPYPYYYHIFTEQGPICGTYLDRGARPCEPTNVVYSSIFPADEEFAGRGTSPAAVHISAYARGGWAPAIVTLVIASLIIGAFCGLPLDASSTIRAVFITGAIVGYHYSQIPIDGPIRYDHGVMYSFSALAVLLVVTSFRRRLFRVRLTT